jgi:hypothetical protein
MGTLWGALKDDWLLASVGFAGVTVGIFGAGIASSDAARAVGRTSRSYVATRWWRLPALLRIPDHRDISTWPTVSARLMPSGGTRSLWKPPAPSGPTTQPTKWRSSASVPRDLSAPYKPCESPTTTTLAGVRAEVAAVRNEHSTAFADMWAEQDERDRQALRFNARGLPLIGASIILSGLPDPIVRNPWVACPLLVAATIATVAVVGRPQPT